MQPKREPARLDSLVSAAAGHLRLLQYHYASFLLTLLAHLAKGLGNRKRHPWLVSLFATYRQVSLTVT